MAATSCTIGDRIGALQQDIETRSTHLTLSDQIALTARVYSVLRELNENAMIPTEEKKIYTTGLQEIHRGLCQARSDTTSSFRLFVNTLQPALPPALTCAAYQEPAIPTVSTYHYIANACSLVKLHPEALRHAPQPLLHALGDLSEKKVEVQWTALDARFLNQFVPHRDVENHLNLCLHQWYARHALAGDDIHDKELQMGVFPELGIERSTVKEGALGAAGYNKLSPSWIHVHPNRERDLMLYSPNNAYLKIAGDSPFAVCWTACEKDNNVIITRMFILLNRDDAICDDLFTSITRRSDLSAHLDSLPRISETIAHRFDLLLAALQDGSDDAVIAAFHELPDCYKKGILKHLPVETSQFDRAQWTIAIHSHIEELQHLLVTTQQNLLRLPESTTISGSALALMECASLFAKAEGDADLYRAFVDFNALPNEDKDRVFCAFWEISGCPRGNPQFGKEGFYAKGAPENKAQALLLVAAQKAPLPPLAEPIVAHPVRILTGDPIVDTVYTTLTPEFQELSEEDRSQQIRHSLGQDLSIERISEALHFLTRTYLFSLQTESVRTQLFNDLLNLYPDPIRRNQIHGEAWAVLPSDLKKRPFSGKNHIGYNTEFLRSLF